MEKVEMAILSGIIEEILDGDDELLKDVSNLQEKIKEDNAVEMSMIVSKFQEKLELKLQKIEKALSKVKTLHQLILDDITEKESSINLDIDKLNLSVRTFNSLKRAGINTVKDLTKKTITEMSDAMQPKNLNEVRTKLISLGLDFSEVEANPEE